MNAVDRLRRIDPAPHELTPPEALLERLMSHPVAPLRQRREWLPSAPRLALGGACVAAALATAVLLPGGAARAPDARAELARIATTAAAFDSGRVTYRLHTEPPTSTFTVDSTYAVTVDAGDSDVQTAIMDGADSPNGERTSTSATRVVGGRLYVRTGGSWREEGPTRGDATRAVTEQFDSGPALIRAAAGATDVTRTSSGDATTYRATVPGARLPKTSGIALDDSGAGRDVALTVTVGPHDVVRGLTTIAAHQRLDATFAGLGRPQHIVAPGRR